MALPKNIGKVLRLIRIHEAMSLTAMAEKINAGKSRLSEIENGNKLPSLEFVLRYEEKFGIPAFAILFIAEHLDDYKKAAIEFGNRGAIVIDEKTKRILDWIAERAGGDDGR